MDLKEIGIGGVVVIGGAIYGISEYGLSDVLTDEIKYVHEIPMEEREDDLNPKRTEFVEVVQSLHDVPKAEVKNLRKYYAGQWMCDFEDSTMFTDKGWSYTTKMKNKDGRIMVTVSCKPEQKLGLRS